VRRNIRTIFGAILLTATPGVFAQDDFDVTPWLLLSGGAQGRA
jgi:hypothetical protein